MAARFRRRRRPRLPRFDVPLSIYEPVPFGVDENGEPVEVTLIYRNLLAGKRPGSGKSSLLNTIIAHIALCSDARLWLLDGNSSSWGRGSRWRTCSSATTSPTPTTVCAPCKPRWTAGMSGCAPSIAGRPPEDGCDVIVCVIDELAFFSVTVGTKDQQEEFKTLVRDLVARGRAAGIIMIVATQRPSATSSPPRCGTCSDIGWRSAAPPTPAATSSCPSAGPPRLLGEGHPTDDSYRGVGYLLAEGGLPRRFKAAYLNDDQISAVIAHALRIRRRPAG